jgi:adenosylhomocysteine nucleosidase
MAIICPMPMEMAPVKRRLGDIEVVTALTGVGTTRAREATERVLAVNEVSHVVVVGIAGAADPGMRVGDVLVPETMVDGATGASYRATPLGGVELRGTLQTSDDLLVDPEAMLELHRSGIDAMDMETSAIAEVCQRHSVPITAFRAVSDTVNRPVDSQVMTMLESDGSANVGAAIRFIVRRPWRIPHLVVLARDSQRAAVAAAKAAVDAIRSAS